MTVLFYDIYIHLTERGLNYTICLILAYSPISLMLTYSYFVLYNSESIPVNLHQNMTILNSTITVIITVLCYSNSTVQYNNLYISVTEFYNVLLYMTKKLYIWLQKILLL